MEQVQELTGVKKVFNVILTIFTIIATIIAMICVWANVIEINIPGQVLEIGINYFVYNGWKHVADLINDPSMGNISAEAYLSLIISTLAFVTTIVVVYVFGVKGIVKGIRAVITRKRSDIFKNFIIISLTLFAYTIISKMFALHAYGTYKFDETSYVSIYDADGGSSCGVFMWMNSILILAYMCLEKFNKRNVAVSVRNILIAVIFILLLNFIPNLLNESINDFSLFDLTFMANKLNIGDATPLLVVMLVFAYIGAGVGISLFVYLVMHFFFGKEFNKKVAITLTAIASVAALICMLVANPMVDLLNEGYFANAYSVTYVRSNLVLVFSLSLVSLTIMIAALCLNEKEEDNHEYKIDENDIVLGKEEQ